MRPIPVLVTLIAFAAMPALAQEGRTGSTAMDPPPSYGEQSFPSETRTTDRPQEQAAMPEEQKIKRHPGTLRKFNTNTGYGPEVQYEADRREAQQAKQR